MKLLPKILGTMLLLMLLLQSCQSSAQSARLPVSPEDSTAQLQMHPQFQAAAQAAPEFTKACFHRIHELEEYKANHP